MKQRAKEQRREAAEARRVLGVKHPLSELHRAGMPHDTSACPTCRSDLIHERALALWGAV
jgi:hypothetical protein